MPRFHCPIPLSAGAELDLPPAAARHVQVLRHQPGDAITLFNGEGGQWQATVPSMGAATSPCGWTRLRRSSASRNAACTWPWACRPTSGMDWLVEKAAELGVASVQPLHTAHVLRLTGERATKKQAHWQQWPWPPANSAAAALPLVQPVADFPGWLRESAAWPHLRCVLCWPTVRGRWPRCCALNRATRGVFLSGPEGLSQREDAHARAAGFVPVTSARACCASKTTALAALVQAWPDRRIHWREEGPDLGRRVQRRRPLSPRLAPAGPGVAPGVGDAQTHFGTARAAAAHFARHTGPLQHALRRAVAGVEPRPAFHRRGHRNKVCVCIRRAARAAVEQHPVVVLRMEVEHRHRPPGPAVRRAVGAGTQPRRGTSDARRPGGG
jgi:16S rRNA (uracil1498-N3)-methyltransferase